MMTDIFNMLNIHFAIFGAQVVAYGAYTAIRALHNRTPECFLVSDTANNPPHIDAIPVLTPDTCDIAPDTLIIIAMSELLQDEIAAALTTRGYTNLLRLDSHAEHILMSAYFDSIGIFPLLTHNNAATLSLDFAVYEAKNHRDKPLTNPPKLTDWERSIQAGAALVPERIAPLTDDTGDNISLKNRMYSEMTATYWAWKNTRHDWKGICHYRRHFVLAPEQLAALSGVDALLPLPYVCYPDTQAQYGRFVSDGFQRLFIQVLLELYPDKYDMYIEILRGRYQYTYNLVCARSEVFDSYCEFMFRTLEHTEKYADRLPEIATTRALSYAAEVLTSLYFLTNSEKLTIRHIEKRIYT